MGQRLHVSIKVLFEKESFNTSFFTVHGMLLQRQFEISHVLKLIKVGYSSHSSLNLIKRCLRQNLKYFIQVNATKRVGIDEPLIN